MRPLISYFFGAIGLSFIGVRIFSYLFEGILSPFRILRRRASNLRRPVNSRDRVGGT
jgi:hypothetical protein